jgi:CheY-like chemotaxis protein
MISDSGREDLVRPVTRAEAFATGETLRYALQHLFDPAALAASPLARQLLAAGVLVTPKGLHDLLLDGIEQLRPLEPAPARSPGRRHYRYLQLRYLEGWSHAAIAADLGLSPRHANRLHQEAMQSLGEVILGRVGGPPPAPPRAASPGVRRTAEPRSSSPLPASHRPGAHGPPAETRSPESPGTVADDDVLAPEAVDLAEALVGVAATFQGVLAHTHDQLRLDRPATLPPVWINRVALRQILLNLLLYQTRVVARGANETASVLALTGEAVDETVVLTISWQSGGTERRENRSPAGEERALLDAARRLAVGQGAAIELAAAAAGGPAIRLRLSASRPRAVLLIDDNPDVGELLQRMLVGTPYQLRQVRTVPRALALVREQPPDAIVLDVVMPWQDGWEVQATLQRDPQTASIPVIVCSVLPDRELALALNAADFLAKPVTRPALLRALDGVFARASDPSAAMR